MNDPERWVAVGVIGRPHALGGAFLVRPLTRTIDDFLDAPFEQIYLRARGQVRGPFRIEKLSLHKGYPLMQMEGVSDRSAVEAIRGGELLIPEEERWELPEGQFYEDELIGLPVFDERSGRELGAVLRTAEGPAHDYLVTAHPDDPRRDLMIPKVPEFVLGIDTEARRIDVRLPEGLLEI